MVLNEKINNLNSTKLSLEDQLASFNIQLEEMQTKITSLETQNSIHEESRNLYETTIESLNQELQQSGENLEAKAAELTRNKCFDL